jgi:hypothetical protein
VIEDKPYPVWTEWWETYTGEGITNRVGNYFSEPEIELLPERLSGQQNN